MNKDKYRKCSKCGLSPHVDESIELFRFPQLGKNNVLRVKAWAIYCWPEREWDISSLSQLYPQHKVLCGNHFEKSCYINGKRVRISKFAVPGTTDYVIRLMQKLRREEVLKQRNDVQDVPGPSRQQDCLIQTQTKTAALEARQETTTGSAFDKVGQVVPAARAVLTAPAAEAATIQVNPVNQVNPVLQALPVHLDLQAAQTNITASETCTRIEQDASILHARDSAKDKINLTTSVAAELPGQQISFASHKNTAKSKKRNTDSILKSLNVQKASQLTKKERKLYDICKKSFKEINRLRKKIRHNKQSGRIQSLCDSEHIKKLMDLNLSNSFIIMLQSQLKNCPKKPKGRRYNLEDKILALGIYKKSPTTYRLLGRFLALPSPSTLIKLLNKVPLNPGINHQVYNGLTHMAQKQSDEDNICTLVFDEMAIKKFLSYNIRTDLVEGFQDHGKHGRSNQIATSALVFMVCGIRKKWKQPVSFYFSSKSVTSDRLVVLIKETLTECYKSGINVVATVCDMSPVNIKALEKLGATTDQPYFSHDGREIVTIADPPHLLKCTRNMFMCHDIECTVDIKPDAKIVKGRAKWSHVQKFYSLDNNNPNFVFAPLLTEKHLNPNTKQKMRVKLAAQVFSHTVTAGILARVSENELPVEALATATVLTKVDNLFDALNADSQDCRRGKKNSTNMTRCSPHHKLFSDMRKTLKENFKFIPRDPPSKAGWIRTINAVERLWRNIVGLGIESLATRSLNQDPLENFFGCVRYNSGSNCNPTVAQFIAGVKTAIVTNLRHTSQRRNCEDDNAALVDNLRAFLLSDEPIISNDSISQDAINDDTEETDMEETSAEAQACAYVCGFIVKKIRNQNCRMCKKALLAEPNSVPAHIFTSFKEYGEKNSLKYVTTQMINAVELSATALNKVFDSEIWKKNIKRIATSALEKIDFSFLKVCATHSKETENCIKTSVFHIVLKRHIILINRRFAEEDYQKQCQKKIRILKNI